VRLEVRRVCHPCLFILFVIALHFGVLSALCNRFPAMRLNRFVFFSFTLLALSSIGANSYSSIKQHRDSLISHLLLKSWRKKAEEQRVRLFDRLPQSVESKFTPVNFIFISRYVTVAILYT